MKEVTVSMVREILKDILLNQERDRLGLMTDEALLDTDLVREFCLDSLDMTEMLVILYREHGVHIDEKIIVSTDFLNKTTVGNFIEMCNKHIL